VPYAVSLFGLTPGWPSALVQGQAISVLARAAQATGRPDYRAAAERAVGAFTVDVAPGGVRRKQSRGALLYEEYPSALGSGVLNGFLSALWGLYDYLLLTGDLAVKDLCERGLGGLLGSLSLYDTGYWSRYMLGRPRGVSNLASPYYHAEHIVQLYATYMLTAHDALRAMAERWERYARSSLAVLRVVLVKAASRAVVGFCHGP